MKHPQPTSAVRPITIGRRRLLCVNGVELHLDGYRVRTDDQPICLPRKEFDLLRALMENAGQLQTHRHLLNLVWGTGHPDDNSTLRVHIMRLRKKIDTDHNKPRRIRTVPGLGYIFDPRLVEPAHDPKRR